MRLNQMKLRPVLMGGVLVGLLAAGGCQGAMESMTGSGAAPGSNEEIALDADASAAREVAAPSPEMPRAQPQLAKTASISIQVEDMDASLEQAIAITQQQQGDVLNLQDNAPNRLGDRYTAYIQLRVPQENLDATLVSLETLGIVQSRSLTAEDVSNQLVDFQARLRNLRRTEEMLLDIMGRSGEMGEVLQVAQELSNIRSSIEQIDAQLQALQTRVAYATINLNLEAAVASAPPNRALISQLQTTWEGATRSLGDVLVGLMKVGIWLMVFSPFWLMAIAIVWVYHARNQRPATTPTSDGEDLEQTPEI